MGSRAEQNRAEQSWLAGCAELGWKQGEAILGVLAQPRFGRGFGPRTRVVLAFLRAWRA